MVSFNYHFLEIHTTQIVHAFLAMQQQLTRLKNIVKTMESINELILRNFQCVFVSPQKFNTDDTVLSQNLREINSNTPN